MGKWGSKKLKRVTHSGAPCVAKEQIGNGVSEFVMANGEEYHAVERGARNGVNISGWFTYFGLRNSVQDTRQPYTI